MSEVLRNLVKRKDKLINKVKNLEDDLECTREFYKACCFINNTLIGSNSELKLKLNEQENKSNQMKVEIKEHES